MSTQAFKRKLSSSSKGDGILITDITGVGTPIHTATSSSTAGTYDEVWLWAYNDSTADTTLTVQFGGGDPNQTFVVSVPHRCGLIPIVPGLILHNSGTVKAYAVVANIISVTGFVHVLSDS